MGILSNFLEVIFSLNGGISAKYVMFFLIILYSSKRDSNYALYFQIK